MLLLLLSQAGTGEADACAASAKVATLIKKLQEHARLSAAEGGAPLKSVVFSQFTGARARVYVRVHAQQVLLHHAHVPFVHMPLQLQPQSQQCLI